MDLGDIDDPERGAALEQHQHRERREEGDVEPVARAGGQERTHGDLLIGSSDGGPIPQRPPTGPIGAMHDARVHTGRGPEGSGTGGLPVDPLGKELDSGRRTRRCVMGFKTGLLVGLGVGYVLGTKAGRERYDELKSSWDQFMGNPSVQSVVTKGKEVVETGKDRGLKAVEKATDNVKDKLDSGKPTTSSSGRSASSSS
jgi:hypothetical protein